MVDGICSMLLYDTGICCYAFIYFFFFCVCVLLFISFLYILFKNLVLINRQNDPRYQHVLAFCAFLTGAIPKGLILQIFVFNVCVCLVLCEFLLGLILWFGENLYFDDLCAE